MSFVETILPKQAHNDFRGGRVPFYGFLLLLLPVTFRSMVHFLKGDRAFKLHSGKTSEYGRYVKSLWEAPWRDLDHEVGIGESGYLDARE